MTDFTLDTLAAFGKPEIIEELDFEALLAERKAFVVARAPSYGLAYDVQDLEADPVMIVEQSAAYRETLLRARANDVARDNYLYFQRGAALDHAAAFYDVVRMPGESDERLKRRVILAIQGRSTGGTAPRYRLIAMNASLRVADAVVYTQGLSPVVNVAVFAADNNGVADQALLDVVAAAVGDEAVRMVNDTILVRSAVVLVVDVTAALTLTPGASAALVDQLVAALPSAWEREGALGRDLTLDWLRAYLMTSGVHSVSITAPAANVVMQPFQAVRIGAVSLTIAGRAF